ncbi:MAG: hypothetical protein ACJ8A6_11725 [Gemmatimonadales bacterium]
MKRSMCGLIVLAAVAGLGSCGGDPTADSIGVGEHIVADPTTVFVDEGASEFVVVQLLDTLGNQQAADFEVQNVGAGITVEKDTTYLQTTIGTNLETASRFIVGGQTPVATTFDVVSGGVTTTVPVKVVPASFAATFSNLAPVQNEVVTITAAPGYKFRPDANVEFDGAPSVVTVRSPDSTSFSFVPAPTLDTLPRRTVGVVTGVEAPNIPGVALEVPAADSVLIPSIDTLFPAAAPGTAPVIPTPPAGQTSGFFDAGAFTGADVTGDGGIGAQYYQFTVTEAGIYTVAVGWESTSDVDLIICSDASCADADNNNFIGASSLNPESVDLNLVPGTYRFAAVLFDGPPPGRIQLSITH